MGKNALISAMLKFHFGNAVFCSDGQGGTLVSVLFDASTKRMTQIAVKRGRLFGKTVYLPFASVTTATGDGIWLNCTLAQLATFPESEGPAAENWPILSRVICCRAAIRCCASST
jgi:hypothetical protein